MRCQCSGCAEYFTSPTAFEMHRRGSHDHKRYCLDHAGMRALGMEESQPSLWSTGKHIERAFWAETVPDTSPETIPDTLPSPVALAGTARTIEVVEKHISSTQSAPSVCDECA